MMYNKIVVFKKESTMKINSLIDSFFDYIVLNKQNHIKFEKKYRMMSCYFCTKIAQFKLNRMNFASFKFIQSQLNQRFLGHIDSIENSSEPSVGSSNPSQDVNSYIKEISKMLKTLGIKEFENILEIFILYSICFISLIFVVKIVAF